MVWDIDLDSDIAIKLMDKGFRNELRKDPGATLKSLGWQGADDVEIVVKTQRDEVTYLVMPSRQQLNINDDVIAQINAAKTQTVAGLEGGTAGTASTASTVFTICDTISSGGSISTVGCKASS